MTRVTSRFDWWRLQSAWAVQLEALGVSPEMKNGCELVERDAEMGTRGVQSSGERMKWWTKGWFSMQSRIDRQALRS